LEFYWDMLGLVSYCLAIYYYNYRFYNSGIVTVLSNRIDLLHVGLLITIGLIIIYGSWNEYLIDIKSCLVYITTCRAAGRRNYSLKASLRLPVVFTAVLTGPRSLRRKT
jgi:hypothetical protein